MIATSKYSTFSTAHTRFPVFSYSFCFILQHFYELGTIHVPTLQLSKAKLRRLPLSLTRHTAPVESELIPWSKNLGSLQRPAPEFLLSKEQ